MRLLRFFFVILFLGFMGGCSGGSQISGNSNNGGGGQNPQSPQSPQGLPHPQDPQNPAGPHPQGPQIPNQGGEISIQLPGGFQNPRPQIPDFGNQNNGGEENQPAGNSPGDRNNPAGAALPGGRIPEIQVQPLPVDVSGIIGAQNEERRRQEVLGIGLLQNSDTENIDSMMGAVSGQAGVLNALHYTEQFSPHTTNYLSGINFEDVERDLMDYHQDQAVLRGVALSPNGEFYAQCVHRYPPQDFLRPSTKCQINTMLPARPDLRQVELEEDIYDLILDDQRNLTLIGRNLHADDPYLKIIFYDDETQQTSSQFLVQSGAPLNGVQNPIEGSFDFLNLSEAKLYKENGHFYFALFQEQAGDETGSTDNISLYVCNEQNGRISSNCVRREIMRQGGLIDTGENSQFFYLGAQLRFRRGGLTLMESLFYRGSENKEVIYYNLSLNRPYDRGVFYRFPYQAPTQYAFLDWLQDPQDERDFFMCGIRTIRGGSGTFQVDCWTSSYAHGNEGIHDRYDNLLRFMPSSKNSFYLLAPMGQRGPALYVAYPFNVDLSGERAEGILDSISNFITQTKQAHPSYKSKVMKIQFAPFHIQ